VENVELMLPVAVVVLVLELAIVGLTLPRSVVPSKNCTTVDEVVLLVSKPDTVAEIEVAEALLASLRYRRLNELPITGLRVFTGVNNNERQQHQADLDGEGQHSIVRYKFGYRHQFGLITDH
jgi:hypothetical protein